MNTRLRQCLYGGMMLGGLLAAVAQAQYVEDSVDVEYAWVGSLAYNSRSDVVYGASEEGILFTISCRTNNMIKHLHLHYPRRVVYDSTDNKAYCTNYNGSGMDTVLVYDGTYHIIIGKIPLTWVTELLWEPVSDRLYVSRMDRDRVSVIDCRGDTVLCDIAVGKGPGGMELNTRHRKLYVRNWDGESVSIVDLATSHTVATVPIGHTPEAGWYSYEEDKYYCGGFGDRGLIVISGAGDTVLRSIPVSGSPSAVTGNVARRLLMVAAADSVFVVDTERDSVVGRLAVGRQPSALLWSPVSDMVYCANAVSSSVSVIAGDGSRVLGTLGVSYYPTVLLPVASHKATYVGHLGSSWVYVIKDSASAISENVCSSPPLLRVSPNPFRAQVRMEMDGTQRNSSVFMFSNDGRQVAELRPAEVASGTQLYVWNGRSRQGELSPAGVYFAAPAGLSTAGVRIVKLE